MSLQGSSVDRSFYRSDVNSPQQPLEEAHLTAHLNTLQYDEEFEFKKRQEGIMLSDWNDTISNTYFAEPDDTFLDVQCYPFDFHDLDEPSKMSKSNAFKQNECDISDDLLPDELSDWILDVLDSEAANDTRCDSPCTFSIVDDIKENLSTAQHAEFAKVLSEEQKVDKFDQPILEQEQTKDEMMELIMIPKKQKIVLWLLEMLRSSRYNPSVIKWIDKSEGVFRITNQIRIAKMWGALKNNPLMNYEKFSRAMRYYYKRKELEVVRKKLVYKFGPRIDIKQ